MKILRWMFVLGLLIILGINILSDKISAPSPLSDNAEIMRKMTGESDISFYSSNIERIFGTVVFWDHQINYSFMERVIWLLVLLLEIGLIILAIIKKNRWVYMSGAILALALLFVRILSLGFFSPKYFYGGGYIATPTYYVLLQIVGTVLCSLGFALAFSKVSVSSITKTKKCLYCAEIVKQEAIVCRYCGKNLPPIEATMINANTNISPPCSPKEKVKISKSEIMSVIIIMSIISVAIGIYFAFFSNSINVSVELTGEYIVVKNNDSFGYHSLVVELISEPLGRFSYGIGELEPGMSSTVKADQFYDGSRSFRWEDIIKKTHITCDEGSCTVNGPVRIEDNKVSLPHN